MGARASKSGNYNESLGLMPSKNRYISILVAHKSPKVCSGPMGPVILKYSLTQTPKQLDPCPRYPHNMSLQGGRQVLYLCHGNCVSERSKFPLNLPQDSLSLSCWEVPRYCFSSNGGSCGFWLWVAPVLCIVGRSHGSHIFMQRTFTHQKLWFTKT
jgi:hypothetical protein